jgi:hypothetical protein
MTSRIRTLSSVYLTRYLERRTDEPALPDLKIICEKHWNKINDPDSVLNSDLLEFLIESDEVDEDG